MIRPTVLATVVLTATLAGATSPETVTNRYAEGLPIRRSVDAHMADTVVLRPAPRGRVHVAGGTFGMGSSPVEMGYALDQCKHEPIGLVEVRVERRAYFDAVLVHCALRTHFESEGLLLPGAYAPTRRPVTVSSFFMDRTEVRVADYMRCVSAGACGAPGFLRSDARFARPEFPVVLVSWQDARDYCAFAKGRLPTEAEWEFAARGVADRWYPWGNVYNPHLANHGSLALDATDATDGFAGLAPVGSIPDGATPLGLQDMAGNASEWVADAVQPVTDGNGSTVMAVPPYCPREGERVETYGHCCLAPQVWSELNHRCELATGTCFKNQRWSQASSTCEGDPECPKGSTAVGKTCIPTAVPQTPINPVSTDGSLRIIRGGSYLEGAHMQRSAARQARPPTSRLPDVGFRCAEDG